MVTDVGRAASQATGGRVSTAFKRGVLLAVHDAGGFRELEAASRRIGARGGDLTAFDVAWSALARAKEEGGAT